ncbi:Alcohol dehydrogenase (NADP()) [Bifidobacterium saguini DSM 23967]|uniref:Alcohol dehydrogenase (NADP( )) n=2 Tax=Bifidobacterium saguini TaxID=762210 RepID=A0A087D9W9_9BIFI|nr:iron-containing alcohol dehydrogenase [Bifidobacterium saguini]KFI92319.1 Alcohol dehydrogenase (NADP()) [Bifidobacterium saguini DSM 23967]QTB91019.1 iron-containing alcohol dehydrogenase [Bifidobacterium saguini]
MRNFAFSYPTRIYFGKDSVRDALTKEMPNMGETVMLAYGGGSIKRNGIYDEITGILTEAGKTIVDFGGIMGNPTYAKVQEGAKLARENNVDFILAVGGGSTIDCSKAVASQAKLDEDLWDMEYKERRFPTDSLPVGAVPTVSGTGSEMNGGAVITNEAVNIKGGLFAATPCFAVLDPSYTLTVKFRQAISSAFDSFSHCMETYFGSPRTDNVSDDINEAIMHNIIRNIRKMVANPNDYEARSELMWDSAMAENGILKIGKVTDFQCHQIEHQLGAFTNCIHGEGLAVIHPALYRHLAPAAPEKFARFATEIWGIDPEGKDTLEVALAGIDALAQFIKEIGLPTTLHELGDTAADDETLRKVADTCNIQPGCCKQLDRDEIFQILQEVK